MPSVGGAGSGAAACAVLALLACDLAVEARHLPTSLILKPADTLVTVGATSRLRTNPRSFLLSSPVVLVSGGIPGGVR